MPQYFKQELFFSQFTGSYFFISWNKSTPLGNKCDRTHSQQLQLRIFCTFYAHSNSTRARQCIIYYSVGFPSGKERALLEMCNQLWSEICDLLGLYAA